MLVVRSESKPPSPVPAGIEVVAEVPLARSATESVHRFLPDVVVVYAPSSLPVVRDLKEAVQQAWPRVEVLVGEDFSWGDVLGHSRLSAGRLARPAFPGLVSLVAVAASTGGPAALAEVVSALPAGLAAPVVAVQHMPEGFTSALAGRLNARAHLEVREAQQGDLLVPGVVLVAPGDRHVRVLPGGVVAVGDDPPENSHRPSADVFLRSAVEVFGSGVLSVVLSGIGEDGLVGSRAVAAVGGLVLAQDEESSVAWGMPSSVLGAGIGARALPLDEIAREVALLAGVRG